MGRVVQRYADEIFALGNELTAALKRRDTGMPTRFLVGVADVIPKLLAAQLLAPIFSTPTHVVCWEDKLDRLLAELTMHELDMVIADQPFPPTMKGHVHNHMIGQSGVTLLATSELAEQYRRQFPASLDGAPFLLPTSNAALRRSLDDWFISRNVRPAICGEFEDSATLKAFGQEGYGIFPATSIIQREVIRQYKVAVVGQIPSLIQRFYAITVERRLNHPGVRAVIESARRRQTEP
jgi:LysR family transcriptional activator of nhaA